MYCSTIINYYLIRSVVMIFMKLYLAQSVSEEPGILEDKLKTVLTDNVGTGTTLDAKKLEYSAMKSKFRLPRNLFVILLLIILLTAIQHLWYFYFISVMIVSLYFLAILLSFKFPHILKKESFVVIRKELIDKQKEEKKKNKDRVRASERLLNLKEQKK